MSSILRRYVSTLTAEQKPSKMATHHDVAYGHVNGMTCE